MLKNPGEADPSSYVQVWRGIVSTVQEVDAAAEASAAAGAEALPELRKKLRGHLGQLATSLSRELGPAEAQEVLLPLVFSYDEMVLKRLPKNARQAWPLLQAELFGINDGGEKYFHLVDEKLTQVQPSMLLLEVLLYCLGRGFLGRYVNEPAKILPYKERLQERLDLHPRQVRLAAQYRRAERRVHGPRDAVDSDGQRPLLAPLFLYAATFLLILAIPFGIIVLSNLPLSQSAAPPTTQPGEDSQSSAGDSAPRGQGPYVAPSSSDPAPAAVDGPDGRLAHNDLADPEPAPPAKRKRRHRAHRSLTRSEP